MAPKGPKEHFLCEARTVAQVCPGVLHNICERCDTPFRSSRSGFPYQTNVFVQRWCMRARPQQLLQRRGQSLHLDRGGCPELLHPLVPSACRQVMAPPSLLGFSAQQTCCVEEQRHIDTRVGSRHQCVWRSCCLERAAFLGSSYRFSSSISHGSPEVRSPTACLVPVVDTEPLGRKLQRYSTNRCTSGRTKGNGVPDSTSHASPRA